MILPLLLLPVPGAASPVHSCHSVKNEEEVDLTIVPCYC
jgi:hypothetical protein